MQVEGCEGKLIDHSAQIDGDTLTEPLKLRVLEAVDERVLRQGRLKALADRLTFSLIHHWNKSRKNVIK